MAEGTHDDTAPALNTADIVGKAVATMVESSAEIMRHEANPRKTTNICLKGRRFV